MESFLPGLGAHRGFQLGYTEKEALAHIEEVLSMIIEEFADEGLPLPSTDHLTESDRPTVAVTV